MDPIHLIFALLITTSSSYVVWKVVNDYSAKIGRKKRLRQSDRTPLNKQQKKVYKEALQQYQAGNFKSSARMLESLNMTREAVNLLEHCNLIHEAAGILLRINRPNRAGIIYSRHEMWKEAIECYKKANLPEEVAQCSQKSGDLATAVAYYLESGNTREAAECYEELGKHHEAAKLYLQLNEEDKYISQYRYLMEKHPDTQKLEFEPREVEKITEYILNGGSEKGIIEILIKDNMTTPVLIYLVKNKQMERAISVYQRSSTNAGSKLLNTDEFTNNELNDLADIFAKSSAFGYAGIIYERLEKFETAGKMFALAEDYEQAVTCYEKAKRADKVTEMKIEIATRGPQNPTNNLKNLNEKNSSNIKETDDRFRIEETAVEEFADEDTLVEEVSPNQNNFSPNESTEQIEVNQEIPEPDFAIEPKRHEMGHPLVKRKNVISIDECRKLQENSLLQDLNSEQIESLQSHGHVKDIEAGETIINYNSEPVGIYFILSGKIGVFKRVDNSDKMIDKMSSPAALGKLWVFIDQPSSVRFVALENSRVLIITRGNFNRILDEEGSIARHIYKRFTLSLVDKIIKTDIHKHENLEAS